MGNLRNYFLRRAMPVLFAALPLYLVRFSILGIPTNIFEIALYGIFLVVLAGAIRGHELQTLFLLPRERLFRIGLLLLAAGIILSTLFNPMLRAFGILKGWFLDPFLFFLLVRYLCATENYQKASATTFSNRKNWLHGFFCAYAVSGAGVAAIALVYYALGSVTYDGRLAAFFESPNHLAMSLAPALLFAVLEIQNPKSKIQNKTRSLFWILCFVICTFVLYLTKSHGAWFGVLGALALGYTLRKTSADMRVIAMIIVVVSGILLPLATVRHRSFLQEAFHVPERSSAASRAMIWRSALDIGLDNPLFGIGPGGFQEKYLAYQKNYPPYLEWAVPQPHNIYLAFLLQTGILGLAGFLCLLWWFFGRALNTWVLIAMFYILLHGAVDTLYWKNDLSMFFWALLAYADLRSSDTDSL